MAVHVNVEFVPVSMVLGTGDFIVLCPNSTEEKQKKNRAERANGLRI